MFSNKISDKKYLLRRSEIPCQTACGIQLLAGTVSDNLWRCLCLRCALYKFTFYLLTYLLSPLLWVISECAV